MAAISSGLLTVVCSCLWAHSYVSAQTTMCPPPGSCSCNSTSGSDWAQPMETNSADWRAVGLAGATGAVSSCLALTVLRILWMLKSGPGIGPLTEFPTPGLAGTPDGRGSRASSSSRSWAEPRHKANPAMKPPLQRSDSGASFSSGSVGTRTAFLDSNSSIPGRNWPARARRELDF